jgi:hypothetical protein
MSSFYLCDNITSLAQMIRSERKSEEREKKNRNGIVPCTFMQNYFLINKIESYICIKLRLDKKINLSIATRSIEKIISEQDIFRLNIIRKGEALSSLG